MTTPIPADVMEAARLLAIEVRQQCVWIDRGEPAFDNEDARDIIARALLSAQQAATEAERRRCAEEMERLETALVRIAFADRHGRVVRPREDGGIRGVGGMIATFALMQQNGSFVGDAAIAAKYPAIAAAILVAETPPVSDTMAPAMSEAATFADNA